MMLTIDGAAGEGGGQILRTALGLSLVTGTPFTIERIRAQRPKPGLLRQHLTAVEAATRIGAAEVTGAALGSQTLVFRPRGIVPGEHAFAVGTAGSATLVLQTVLPALLTANAPSTLSLEGGTHNPWAPPFDFLAESWLPLVRRMGARVELLLERRGFYPAGGGRFVARIEPGPPLRPLVLLERGLLGTVTARAVCAKVPARVARRELNVIRGRLGLDGDVAETVMDDTSVGPGNVVSVTVPSTHVTEVFSSFGDLGVRAEVVGERVVRAVSRYLAAGVPVGEHLADQLLLPMALARGGAFVTLPPSSHTLTNVEVIRRFVDVAVSIEAVGDDAVRVDIG